MTNVSLKIVRGVETKGIVDIMLESEMSGKIATTFQAKEEGISGLVVTDKQETKRSSGRSDGISGICHSGE